MKKALAGSLPTVGKRLILDEESHLKHLARRKRKKLLAEYGRRQRRLDAMNKSRND